MNISEELLKKTKVSGFDACDTAKSKRHFRKELERATTTNQVNEIERKLNYDMWVTSDSTRGYPFCRNNNCKHNDCYDGDGLHQCLLYGEKDDAMELMESCDFEPEVYRGMP